MENRETTLDFGAVPREQAMCAGFQAERESMGRSTAAALGGDGGCATGVYFVFKRLDKTKQYP